jgi:hypothetical protein
MPRSTALNRKQQPSVAKPVEVFRAGDRVIFAGAGKEWTGVVTARRTLDGTISIYPRMDDTAVYVTFDDTGASVPIAIRQLKKVTGRGR